ncbi:MAG: hypothetical protein KDH94_04565, partial [Coxiellaceae bacterium]|nr:hypothetical protein [Coxiellaceae bacterium]
KIKSWLAQCKQPLLMQYRVNAGFISPEHWVHKDAEGRSRIVGEMSHFIDWMQFITGETVKRVFAERISGNEKNIVNNDNVIVTLKLSGGSLATLNYTASGHRALSRESIEIFCDGLSIRSTDFRVSECFSAKGKRRFKTRGQSLGYRGARHHFMHCVRGLEKPTVSLLDELQTMSVVFNIEAALAKGMPICIS